MTTELIQALQLLPAELVSLMMLVLSGCICLLLFRTFGLVGLYSYISIAVIAANIQVLTATKFFFFPEPIAHGTIVFTSLYLAVNIITEHYGVEAARRAIWISFSAMLMMILLMITTVGGTISDTATYQHFNEARGAIELLFTPAPALFAASFISYAMSQYNDIWIFNLCRKVTQNRFLWLRSNLASMFSALIDNTIFSLLAWWVFADEPLGFSTIVYSYILGTYLLRVFLSALNTPFIYLSYRFKPKNELILSHA